MSQKPKIIRITTVPQSLRGLLRGQLGFMSGFYEIVGVSSPGEALQDVEQNEKIRVMGIQMSRTISLFSDLKSLWQLYGFLKKEKPLIVHSHTPKAGIVGMLAAKLAGVPYRLHTVAGLPLLETTGFKRKILDAVERLTYACATKVYPNSFGLLKIIQQNNYAKPAKLKVLANGSSNGIDTKFFDPGLFTSEEKRRLRDSLHIAADNFVYVFVGRLVKDKGINELVTAFGELQKTQDGITLLLVGPFEQELNPLSQQTLDALNQNPDILCVGYQKDVRGFLGISDALVFPSYREGFPNVVMQAGAMGLPCIVSDINGCNEIIKENCNGLIIPVKDSKAIQNAMQLLLADSGLFENLKQNARPEISSRYEQHVVWQAILAEYKKLAHV